MIDLHCHILPGIDDGPPTIEESVAIARAAVAAGTTTVIATSHVCWNHRNDSDTIARGVAAVAARLEAEEIPLEVRAGAEIAMTRVEDIEATELSRLTLGGGTCLLIEPPFTPIVSGLDWLVFDLQRKGYRVLLAHPERCPAFHRDRSLLESLVGAGVLTSITAGSLVGRFGRDVRRVALELFRDGLVHNVASDAHSEHRRPPGISGELAQAGLAPLEHWLTVGVPQALLDGGEIPPRPYVEMPAAGWRAARWRSLRG